jgi:hypothetical protein
MNRFAIRSDKMADISRKHHENLQKNTHSPEMEEIRMRI